MALIPVKEFGELEAPLRNIRTRTDGDRGVFDLIPEALLEPGTFEIDESNPIIRRIFDKGRLIVEGPTFLRIEFGWLLAIAGGEDVDEDLFGGLHANWTEAPRLSGSRSYYPFLEITSSPWKAQLPEWKGCNNPDVRHFRMISATASFDVLGELSSGVWLPNPHFEA